MHTTTLIEALVILVDETREIDIRPDTSARELVWDLKEVWLGDGHRQDYSSGYWGLIKKAEHLIESRTDLEPHSDAWGATLDELLELMDDLEVNANE